MTRSREIDRFLWYLGLSPVVVLLALALQHLIASLMGAQGGGGMLPTRASFLSAAFYFGSMLLALAGSVLAILGAIRLTERVKLPRRRARQGKRRY